jgi:hypothetical protein
VKNKVIARTAVDPTSSSLNVNSLVMVSVEFNFNTSKSDAQSVGHQISLAIPHSTHQNTGAPNDLVSKAFAVMISVHNSNMI